MMRGMKSGFTMKRVWIVLLVCLCVAKAGVLQAREEKMLSGSIVTDAYVAEARVRSSDGEVSGAVIFTMREGGNASGLEAVSVAFSSDGGFGAVRDYALKGRSAASGEALIKNLDGSIARGEDGSLTLYVRYELPKGMRIISLFPIGRTAEEIPLR